MIDGFRGKDGDGLLVGIDLAAGGIEDYDLLLVSEAFLAADGIQVGIGHLDLDECVLSRGDVGKIPYGGQHDLVVAGPGGEVGA